MPGKAITGIGVLVAVVVSCNGCSHDRGPDITVTDRTIRARIENTYERAQNGEAEAQNSIGRAYAVGDGLARDRAKARRWLERAARQGHPVAQYNLYLLLSQGAGAGTTAAGQASKWLRAASEREMMYAQFRLAERYRKGESNEPKDMRRAAALYEASARQGYAPAQYDIGYLYDAGNGVPKNAVKAFGWFLRAARQGVIKAQIKVGFRYSAGVGVAANDRKAFLWFRQAAVRNSSLAQYNLSLMYGTGKGVEKDLVKAFAWSELAAGQGVPAAVKNRKPLRDLLTPDQLKQARSLVEQWAQRMSPRAAISSRDSPSPSRDWNQPAMVIGDDD